jgi:integrase/recombinase XerD
MVDIHNYKKRLDSTLKRIKRSKLVEISRQNKKDIFDFHNSCFSEGIGAAKIQRYVFDLSKVAKLLKKDFRIATKQDLQRVVAELEKTDYATETKRGIKIAIKKFIRWLKGIDEKGVYPEEVKWISTTNKNGKHKLPEELLTEDDINKLLNNCLNERNRAFVSCLYESGCRIAEILTLKLKNIHFDNIGAKVTVFGKTGSRRIRLFPSSVYLQQWINKHPDKDNPDAFLWVKNKGELIGYARVGGLLRKVAERAGIKKRVNPHSFRHARATILANDLTESQLKEIFGWSQSSDTPAIYVHLSNRDTDKALMKIYGIETDDKDKEKNSLTKLICIRCKTENESINKFCKTCGLVLDKKEATKLHKNDLERSKVDAFMDKLIEDPETLKFLEKKINSL